MKFYECANCQFRRQEEVCEDCDSGEQYEPDDELNFDED